MAGQFGTFENALVTAQSNMLKEGEFLIRFVRQSEYNAIRTAIAKGDKVTLGRYFTQDFITNQTKAGSQLALPNVINDPIVGFVKVPAISLRGNAFMGPRLVRPDFSQIGFGTEIEFFAKPVVSSNGMELGRF